MTTGILVTGAVTLLYCTVGGLWADGMTEFGQFVIQGVAALAMMWVVLDRLGGVSGIGTLWHRLPREPVRAAAPPATEKAAG